MHTNMLEGVVIWAVVATTAAIIGALLAGYKNRGYSAWTAWCFLLPPLVLVLLLLPKYKGQRPRSPKLDDLDSGDRPFV